jgi:hypothetical protein
MTITNLRKISSKFIKNETLIISEKSHHILSSLSAIFLFIITVAIIFLEFILSSTIALGILLILIMCFAAIGIIITIRLLYYFIQNLLNN